MSYNNRPKGYLGNIVNNLRDARYALRILYDSSIQRAEREGTGLVTAIGNNMYDICRGNLDSLLIPVGAYSNNAVSEPQYATGLLREFSKRDDRKHKGPKKKKDKKKGNNEPKRRKAGRDDRWKGQLGSF